MCSIPPAMTTSYWPAITPIAAKLAACWPEPHIRSRVVPHTSTGKPAISAALRAMLNPCSPSWSTQPRMTSSISAGSTFTRATRSFSTSAARSSGRTSESLPPFRPTAVRTAPTMTASLMANLLNERTIIHLTGSPGVVQTERGRGSGDPALDLVRQLAERADRPGRHLAAAKALVEGHGLRALEGGSRPVQEAEEEVVLGARRGVLQTAQDFLVGDRGRPFGERAFLHDVVDLPEEREGGRLALGQPIEWLDAPHQLRMRRRERGGLARQRIGLPVHHRTEKRRRLIVEVVAGRDHRDPVIERHAVHEVALGEAAARARRPPRDVLDDRDGRAHFVADRGHHQRDVARRGESLALGLRLDGVVEDPEVQVEPGRPVPFVDQDVPERQRVLTAGDGDQHELVLREHPVLPDGLADLIAEELEEVRRAEGGVVTAQLENGRLTALAALQSGSSRLPPDITGRSSMVASSRTT